MFGPGCDEQRLPFVTLLSRAADDAGLPDAPEFRAAIMGYAEWGTRFAVHNSQPGAGDSCARLGATMGVGRRAAV